MRFNYCFIRTFILIAICFYFYMAYYGFILTNIQKYIRDDNNNGKTVMRKVCELNSEDVEREKILSLTFPERRSMTLEAKEKWEKTSVLHKKEWKNLFDLNMMDGVQRISCKDPNGRFNQSIFEEMKLFFIKASIYGPLLQRNTTCFDKLGLNKTNIHCEYSYIERRKFYLDSSIHVLHPITISDDEDIISLEESYNSLGITCKSTQTSLEHLTNNRDKKLNKIEYTEKIFYRDVFMYIPKVSIGRYILQKAVSEDTHYFKMEYSVIIFTFDGTSRSTFLRNLPLTANYLKEGRAVLFQNHHRLGENSYPNVIPLLTGQKLEKLQDGKDFWHKGIMENIASKCNMTWGWKLWEDEGYPTMFHEDMPGCAEFNLHGRLGWKEQPTTIYHRPAYLAMEELRIRNQDLQQYCKAFLCINNSPLHKRYLGVVDMLAKTYCKTAYFAYFHVSEYSHGKINLINNMDKDFLGMLQELDSLGCLNRTLLVLMGDHGNRMGNFANMRSGWLDSNTPLLYIRLPQQLKQKNPDIQEILLSNQDKMTTMLDIHKTFTDPIITNKEPQSTAGLSLLHPLPERTCEEALVPPDFCTCPTDNKKVDPENSDLISPSEKIASYINKIANHSNCTKLQLDRIDWAHMDNKTYHIQLWLKAVDSNIISARFHGVFNIKDLSVKSVRRTEVYHTTSQCITDDSLDHIRPFCICNK